MMKANFSRVVALIMPLCLSAQAPPASSTEPHEPLILRIRVLRGEGAEWAAGTRVSQALEVEITGETGEPVEGAAVNFRLPADGAGGLFSNGLGSDLAITGPDGRATVSGIRWNRLAGPVQIRVTAAKGQVRVATIVNQHVTEPRPTGVAVPHDLPLPRSSRRWLTVTLLAAGAAAGGVAASLAIGRRAPTGQPPPAVGPSVGTPTITIGGPN